MGSDWVGVQMCPLGEGKSLFIWAIPRGFSVWDILKWHLCHFTLILWYDCLWVFDLRGVLGIWTWMVMKLESESESGFGFFSEQSDLPDNFCFTWEMEINWWWRSWKGTRCAGMSSVCCSLIFDSWRFGHLGLWLIGFGIDRFHLTVGLVDFMTPLAVLSPSLLRCNPINSVWESTYEAFSTKSTHLNLGYLSWKSWFYKPDRSVRLIEPRIGVNPVKKMPKIGVKSMKTKNWRQIQFCLRSDFLKPW